MANLTTSADIDTFMGSANNAAARTNLGVLPLAGGTLTGQVIQSTNGAASTPPLLLNGTIFTGGTGTTNFPNFLIQPTGATAATGWITSGTALGINLDVAAGRFLDLRIDGVERFYIDMGGSVTTNGSVIAATGYVRAGNIYLNNVSNVAEFYNDSCAILIGAGVSTADLRRGGAYCLQLGTDAAPVSNQHFKACNRITSDGPGANLTISGGNGRGDVGGSLIFATYSTGGTGVAGTLTTRLTIDGSSFTFVEGSILYFGSTTGTKVGGASSEKLAFWGKTPIIQPTNAITASAFTSNTSGIADDSATFGGYTLGQIAAALIDAGILA